MNTSFKSLFVDKMFFFSFWASVGLYFLSLIIIALAYRSFPPFLPIYNKLAWGYARLGRTYEIIIPFGIPILFSTLNVFLARYLYSKIPLLSRFLFMVTLLAAFFTFIFILKLTLIIL